ncbi:MAG: carotenoid 1,2-hydratase, partial [Methylococcaceae bacterium]|nr:carotenoid 1,2-hydratase [Methylococcaceae bacterium]
MVALLLSVLVALVWLQPFISPSDFKLASDNFFSETLSKKDDSFSNVLSKDDKGFARALKPKEFTFPPDHGPHNPYRSEWW